MISTISACSFRGLIQAGVRLEVLKYIMGHTTIRVTERYVQLSQSVQNEVMATYELAIEKAAGKVIQ
jgi:hypothetical protein